MKIVAKLRERGEASRFCMLDKYVEGVEALLCIFCNVAQHQKWLHKHLLSYEKGLISMRYQFELNIFLTAWYLFSDSSLFLWITLSFCSRVRRRSSRHSWTDILISLTSIFLWEELSPSLSTSLVLVAGRFISILLRTFVPGAVWFGVFPGFSMEWPPDSDWGDDVLETAIALFFARKASSLILFRLLLLGELRFTLLPGRSECWWFLTFWVSREKEKVGPTLKEKQKSTFLARSCLVISRQSLHRIDSSAEVEWSIMCLFSKSRHYPATCLWVLHIAMLHPQSCFSSDLLRRQVPAYWRYDDSW